MTTLKNTSGGKTKKIIFQSYEPGTEKWITEFEPITTAIRLGELEVAGIGLNTIAASSYLERLEEQETLLAIVRPNTNNINTLPTVKTMWNSMGVPMIVFCLNHSHLYVANQHGCLYACVTGPELMSMIIRILSSYVDLITPKRLLIMVKRFIEAVSRKHLDCFETNDYAQKIAASFFPRSIVGYWEQHCIAVTVGNIIMRVSRAENPEKVCETALLSTLDKLL